MPKKNEYKGIKVPLDVYEDLNELKEIVVRKGLNSLSGDFINYVPKKCPKCDSEMDSTQIKLEHAICPHCNYSHQKLDIGLGGSLALGTLIGLGIAGIVYLLSNGDKLD